MTHPSTAHGNLLHYDIGDGVGPLSRLLAARTLRTVFQPIVDMASGSVYAHEQLVRGPRKQPLRSPDSLRVAAQREGLLQDFEIACAALSLRRWARRETPGKLFVNIGATALCRTAAGLSSTDIARGLRSLGVDPQCLVLELTEHEEVEDLHALADAIDRLHTVGVAIAIDDFGNSRYGLRMWAELRPDIVKIDAYFVRDASRRPEARRMLRTLVELAATFGTRLVAEGVETAEDLTVVRDLGIDFAQGFLLGKPSPEPVDRIANCTVQLLLRNRRPIDTRTGAAQVIEGPALHKGGIHFVPLARGSANEFCAGMHLRRVGAAAPTLDERMWFDAPAFVHPSEALEYSLERARSIVAGRVWAVGHH